MVEKWLLENNENILNIFSDYIVSLKIVSKKG